MLGSMFCSLRHSASAFSSASWTSFHRSTSIASGSPENREPEARSYTAIRIDQDRENERVRARAAEARRNMRAFLAEGEANRTKVA